MSVRAIIVRVVLVVFAALVCMMGVMAVSIGIPQELGSDNTLVMTPGSEQTLTFMFTGDADPHTAIFSIASNDSLASVTPGQQQMTLEGDYTPEAYTVRMDAGNVQGEETITYNVKYANEPTSGFGMEHVVQGKFTVIIQQASSSSSSSSQSSSASDSSSSVSGGNSGGGGGGSGGGGYFPLVVSASSSSSSSTTPTRTATTSAPSQNQPVNLQNMPPKPSDGAGAAVNQPVQQVAKGMNAAAAAVNAVAQKHMLAIVVMSFIALILSVITFKVARGVDS